MQPGTVIGSYRLVKPLGSGGMGDVWVAEDTRLDRKIALKLLKPRFAADPERLDRFEREAKAIAALNHPNIVTIHSVEEATVDAANTDGSGDAAGASGSGDAAGTGGSGGAAAGAGGSGDVAGFGDAAGAGRGRTIHFLTMELVEGKPLSELIPKRGFDLQQIFELAIPLVDAISAAHKKGIAHRDLKPANVLVTAEGRVKVLDFGLAKLLEDRRAEDDTEAGTYLVTEEGQVLGTVAYMSPEQAEGKPVDHRTDLFSLGILLYEMSTGERPFKGDSKISLLSSLIKDTPTSVTNLNRSLPNQLGRIVKRCLEKAPERRFQTALDLKNELEDLREETSLPEIDRRSGGERPALAPPATVTIPRSWLVSGGVLLAVLVIAAFWGLWTGSSRSPDATAGGAPGETEAGPGARASSSGGPALAVLYFDNLSGDASLDWLRTGLADMLVTDLSQSPDLKVVGTDRLYEILDGLGQTDARVTSAELVQAVAAEAGAGRVVVGSFMRAGGTVRISARLQDAASGEVLRAESVEARDEAAIFSAVDDLTDRIRAGLDVAIGASPVAIDRDLTDITTDSVDAYRDYAEGVRLLDRSRYVEAIPRFLAATEADPDFAMAWAKLSVVSSNLFDNPAALRYGERALQHADRLTERERLYIEGHYYSLRSETVEQSIEAYEELLELYPDDLAARNNVALRYAEMEQFDRAAEHLREALRRGTQFAGATVNLAFALCNAGRCEEGLEVLEDFGRRAPDYAVNHLDIGNQHLRLGRLDEAAAAFERFREVALPQTADTQGAWWSEWWLATLREDWRTAGERIDEGLRSEVEFFRVQVAPMARVITHLHRGRVREARTYGEETLRSSPADNEFAENLRNGLAYQLLAAGEAETAIGLLEGHEMGDRVDAEVWRLSTLAVAQARLGRQVVAEARANDARRRASALPQPSFRRRELLLRGVLAIGSGDPQAAIPPLEEAEALLPPSQFPPAADHAPIWYWLGVAHLDTEARDRAAEYFEKVVDAASLRLFEPVLYVRSFWHLGQLAEERGDTRAALEHYRRFLDYWSDGDIDRDRIEQARRFLREH